MCEPLHVFTIDERIKSEGGALMASLWPSGVVPLPNSWRVAILKRLRHAPVLLRKTQEKKANEP